MRRSQLGLLWRTELGKTEDPKQAFMIGIDEYIKNNVTFNGTFIGTDSKGNTIEEEITCKINTGNTAKTKTVFNPPPSLNDDGLKEWTEWIESIYAGITQNCKLIPDKFIPTSTGPCFRLIRNTNWTRQDLAIAIQENPQNPDAFLDRMAEGMMDDMQELFIPEFTGTVGTFVGTLTVTSVSTP